MLVFAFLTVLCVFDIAGGTNWAESSPSISYEPVRTEARLVGTTSGIVIINKTIENNALLPIYDADNLRLRQDLARLVLVYPVRPQNEFRYRVQFWIAGLLVGNRESDDLRSMVQLRDEGGTLANVLGNPVESKWERLQIFRRPPVGITRGDHNQRPIPLHHDIGLVRYAPPLPPSKPCVNACSDQDRELRKKGEFFVARHLWFYLLLVLIGAGCCIQGFRQASVMRCAAYQCFAVVLCGVGLYALLSLVPPRCCDQKANGPSHRLPPKRGFSSFSQTASGRQYGALGLGTPGMGVS